MAGKKKFVQTRALAKVGFKPTNDDPSDPTTAMILTDTKGHTVAYNMGPEGVSALLLSLLGLSEKWCEHPDFARDEIGGPKNALPATAIRLQRGRADTECAVRVYLGKIEVTFLMPLNSVVKAMGDLVGKVTEDASPTPH